MAKNLKISYILMFVFSGILIAWHTLSNFLGGVALNFVGLVGIVFTIIMISLNDESIMKRIKDIFVVACVLCALELIIYFACEFGYGEELLGFVVYQNILSFLGMLFCGYIAFRFANEIGNKRIKFIEVLLGNEKKTVKEKKAKEISNGSLEDKPNNKPTTEETTTEDEENVVIVETEE